MPDVAELGAALAAWLRALRLPPAVLVGTSVGSQVALEAALADPEATAGVVLASPTVDRERRRWRDQVWRWQLEQSTQSGRMRRVQLADWARTGPRRGLATFRHALRHRPEERVTGLRAPLLVVWGSHDPLLRREWAQELADRAPDGRLAVLPGAVHAASHEDPVALARVVHGFLDDLAARRT